VLLDEIGRGTSTYDGVSIAWAVSEHLHERTGCKTIFATHYHELVQLADELVAVRNYNVGVREVGDQLLFLHRLQPGGADRSYGIEVGRLAGLPTPVIERARQVLTLLEGEGATLVPALASALATRAAPNGQRARPQKAADADQFALFAAMPHPVVEALRSVDVNTLTPLAALQLVAELAERARS
jgi:DNA mismatch repair protein MutS